MSLQGTDARLKEECLLVQCPKKKSIWVGNDTQLQIIFHCMFDLLSELPTLN